MGENYALAGAAAAALVLYTLGALSRQQARGSAISLDGSQLLHSCNT